GGLAVIDSPGAGGDNASAGTSNVAGSATSPACKQVCPTLSCASGNHVATLPGQCCPTCVLDPAGQACADGQKAYSAFRTALVSKYQALPCRIDSDCIVVEFTNDCETVCGGIELPSSQSSALVSMLNDAAAMDCATCGARESSCAVPPLGSCINQRCSTPSR
ncbi:MAG TPA: hypothetical protein VNW92_17185, partial [Polyangiaceae bacterium]|nr:hypothetical protein [Polyangiaceae bacterium]